MRFPLPFPRFHFYEIADQSWFPAILREKVQASLTILWKIKVPLLQSQSAASSFACTLRSLLGSSLTSYTFVDFCSGAGGPTTILEHEINLKTKGRGENAVLGESRNNKLTTTGNDIELVQLNGAGKEERDIEEEAVDFVLTDIHPHLEAWERAAKRSDHVKFVRESVDAGDAPLNLLAKVDGLSSDEQRKKIFRLFSLAFHHFDNDAAIQILRNTLATSSGFCIVELQERTFEALITMLALGPSLWIGSWYWFWGDWMHLFWTYVIPIVPLVVVLDGLVSAVRTRSGDEIMALMRKGRMEKEMRGWRFERGRSMHTWPTGQLIYFVGVKDD
ncbi:MAG: hypothetical protein Q9191_000951 [Dirinaria sp. TL-2023a]